MREGKEKCIQKFFLKPEGKRSLETPTYKWKDNIEMDLQETGCERVDWNQLAQIRD
jgi:hypothetical protein